jgi:D-sedoheptulose 7-phosphate isomerase
MPDETTTKPGATSYLQDLTRILLSTSVTDARGTELFLDTAVDRAIDLVWSRREGAAKVMLVGNGGSAAIVSHAQNDLCKMIGAKAMVFHETSYLTALANDDGYETAFETNVRLWGAKGDLLVAVSSSGRSENILRAVRAARVAGCEVLTFSGFKADNPLRGLGDLNFYVKSGEYGFVEVSHMALLHLLTDIAARRIKETKG